MLAGRRGRPVAEDDLIEAIWGETPPESARTAVQTYLSSLRDLLEPGRPRRSQGRYIATEERGYRLDLGELVVDIIAFEAEVERGIDAADDDPVAAAALLDMALARWGEPFGDLSADAWAAGIAARLRERHAVALETRAAIALADGEAALVSDRLREAVELYPFREELAALLMRALYRLGDQAAALRVGQAMRRRLRDELGLDPGPRFVDVEQAILQHGADLIAPRASPTDESDPDAATHLLPPLLGRDELLDAVTALVDQRRLISLVGAGGIGKTSLAEHVAANRHRRGDATHTVDIDEIVEPTADDVLRAIAAAMKITEHTLASLDETICDAIGTRLTLVVIDTAEVAPGAVVDVANRLQAARQLRLLVTSQVPLRAVGEHVVAVPPLDLASSAALLSGSHHGDVGHDPAVVDAICDTLGRVPLALELAAARLQTFGAAETLRQLQQGAVLEGGTDRPARQRSTTSAARWSIDLATPEERALLVCVTHHAGPFSVRTARHLWAKGEPGGADVERCLVGLIERSLVSTVHEGVDEGNSRRFRVLDTVRAAVAGLDGAEADAASARERIAEVVLESAQATLFGMPAALSLDELIGELVPVLDRLHAERDPRELVLAGCLALFWVARSRAVEGSELLDRALAAHCNVPPMLLGPTTGIASFLAYCRGDMHRTRHLLAEMDSIGGRWMVPAIRATVDASTAFLDRRYDDAADAYAETLTHYDRPTSPKLLNVWLGANSLWYAGRHEEALAQYQRLRREAESVDDAYNIALGLRFESMVHAQLGDIDRAWRLAERAMSSARALNDDASLGQAEVAVAIVALAADAIDEAEQHALAAIHATLRPYDLFTQRAAPPIVAAAALERDDPATAALALGWYLDYLDRTGQPPGVATAALSADVESRTRAALGPAEFSRRSAAGAALRLRELHDALVAAVPERHS